MTSRGSIRTVGRAPRLLALLALGSPALGLAALVSGPTARHAAGAPRPASVAAAEQPLATTDADQRDLALTVYNQNLALVREVRRVSLPAGDLVLRFEDIATAVNPATVHVRSLTAPSGLEVLEQNYEYDLLEPQKLLQKYVGREVTLVRARHENGSTRYDEVKATLLSLNNGPIWRIGSEIVTGLPADHYRFPELPDNLFSHPTLVWMLSNRGPRQQDIEVSYLTGGVSWASDYVLTVGRDDRQAALDGWVTLTNRSGTTFRNARLQLVAGDVNRVGVSKEAVMQALSGDQVPEARPFTREAFADYHLYSLGRRTSVRAEETKQVSLLGAPAVPVAKRYVVEGQRFYYRNARHPGSAIKDVVQVYYSFRNDEASGLGQPLPAGTIRVYQADSTGGVHFVGEDRIDHTPQDETISLHVGHAFDIVAERRQTDYRRMADTVWELAFAITIRNHKTAPVQVEVDEPVAGDWEVLQASHRWSKTEAWALRFEVPVPAGGEATVTYRVRIR
jgi:hypothetical protein